MKSAVRTIVRVWLPLITLLVLAKLFSLVSGISLRHLLLDPTETTRVPFYIGIISNIGILLWAAAATVCLFTALALGSMMTASWRSFLLISGGLTLLLLLDDLLRIHDEIFPVYLGIKGDVLGLIYVGLFALYFFRFRTLLRKCDTRLLVLALGCFGISIAIDAAPPAVKSLFTSTDMLLLEDSAKLLGIATWLSCFVHLSSSIVRQPVVVPVDLPVVEFPADAVGSRA